MSIIATLYWFNNLDKEAQAVAIKEYRKEFKYDKLTDSEIGQFLDVNCKMFYADGKRYRM